MPSYLSLGLQVLAGALADPSDPDHGDTGPPPGSPPRSVLVPPTFSPYTDPLYSEVRWPLVRDTAHPLCLYRLLLLSHILLLPHEVATPLRPSHKAQRCVVMPANI